MGIIADFVQPIVWRSESGHFKISVWGIFTFFSAFFSYFFLKYLFSRHRSKIDAFDFVVVAYTAGLIGAKLHSVLDTISLNSLGNIQPSSGMNWQGGMILATISCWIFIKSVKESVSRITDISVAAVAICHGIGKLGCFFSGDGCYGTPSQIPWAMSFPNGLIPTHQFVHPAPLYEFLLSLTTALVLWKKSETWLSTTPISYRPWDNTTIFFAYIGFSRFCVEFIRNHSAIFLGLSSYQFIGFAIFIASIAVRIYLSNQVWLPLSSDHRKLK
jgi:phosphatidylglycerol:prolipoprotein diacylglycerol transferase